MVDSVALFDLVGSNVVDCSFGTVGALIEVAGELCVVGMSASVGHMSSAAISDSLSSTTLDLRWFWRQCLKRPSSRQTL